MLSAEGLLAGSEAIVKIEVPEQLLVSGGYDENSVTLRPLTVQDLRLINRAARENDDLTAALMVQRALVEPELNAQQISSLSAGLLQFLLQQVNRISGIHISQDELTESLQNPLVQASLQLAREYGWTPQQIGELTLGQMLMHLEMTQTH